MEVLFILMLFAVQIVICIMDNLPPSHCNKLLEGLKAKENDEGLDFKKGMLQLSMDVNVAPDTNPYHYFSGSKFSCHCLQSCC